MKDIEEGTGGLSSEKPYAQPSPKNTAKSRAATLRSTLTRGAAVVFAAVLLLLVSISLRWMDGTTFVAITSWSQRALINEHLHYPPPPKSIPRPQPEPITFTCSNSSQTAPVCQRIVPPSPSPSPASFTTPQVISPASCPDYFRWIHEDLRPWKVTGITKETVETARKFAAFRLVTLDGRVYVDTYHRVFQTRDVFTLWGILQLVNRYPGRVPDLDLMFNCDDTPVVRAADYREAPPPPLFRYCKDNKTVDILFPDWSFWGWPELNIKPWETLMKEVEEGNEKVKWGDRAPYAFWKGNPSVSQSRSQLMKCNVSRGSEWNARLYPQDWNGEVKRGFKDSNLANQCHHRYKIFVEGRAWSVSKKYVMACDSPALFVTTHFDEFFSRDLIPGRHYWPIRESSMCSSIKFAVDWGNQHQNKAQDIGKMGSSFLQEQLKMDNVYDYMLHLLTEYSKLLRYKPTIPENATELCLESMACSAGGTAKAFMLESMAKLTREDPPCALPPPYKPEELGELLAKKAESLKKLEAMEQKAWRKEGSKS